MTKLPLAGHAPSGLGFRPDGSLLIASTENRQVLRYDGDTVDDRRRPVRHRAGETSATWWSTSAAAPTSDPRLVRAASSCGSTPMSTVTSSPSDLDFPNGMVITPDGKTLIVAESIGRRADRVHDRRRWVVVRSPDLRRRTRRAARRHRTRRRRRGLDVDDAGQPVRPDRRGRHGHRPHRHRRPHRDRVHARRTGAPHTVPALEHRAPIRSDWSAPSCLASTP